MSDYAQRKRGGPLEGVRVLEITKVWAGPYAGKILAMLGAEVIKVESNSNLDELRAYGGVDINSAPYFLSVNQEVLSVQVNMKSEAGMKQLRDMIAKSDIVLNNIRPGAMERAGLSYPELKQIKPDIINVSIKMYGNDGPLGYQTGYAPSFAALGGLNTLVGYEDGPPLGINMRYGDSTVGASAVFAAIAALLHRDRTGEGQDVDVSAVETMSAMAGDSLVAYGLTGVVPRADGNAHSELAPHNCYPCRDGEWLSIAVGPNKEWQAFCSTLGHEALATDPQFSTASKRQAERARLDEIISELTKSEEADVLADRLRKAGVPAFKSLSALDLIKEEYFWASDLFRMVSDKINGVRPITGVPWRMSQTAAVIERGAPLLGEDNEYVYKQVLGISDEDYDGLLANGVID